MRRRNPYEAPRTDETTLETQEEGDERDLPVQLVNLMRETKPWVTFLAVMGFIAVGLMALGGIFVLASGAGGGIRAGMGFVYVVLAAIYLVPSLYLQRYGSSIRAISNGGGMDALVVAIRHQKAFWRFVGIMTVVLLCFYFVAIVAGIGMGIGKFLG